MLANKSFTLVSQLGDEGLHHREFMTWAQQQKSVKINGVEPALFPGAGTGVVATRDIIAGEALVFVPAKSLLTVDPDAKFEDARSQMSVHGRLALEFLERTQSTDITASLKPWLRAMPDQKDVFDSAPVKWTSSLCQYLPTAANSLLTRQREKHDKDVNAYMAIISQQSKRAGYVLPDEDMQQAEHSYSHAWLLINSRSFYWDYPKTASIRNRRAKQRPRDDCIALCPYIDLFNHVSGQSCLHVEYNKTGYTVRADRNYVAGTELNVSYGAHSNDFLLVEYGFVLDEPPNTDDHALLDDFIEGHLQKPQRDALESRGLLGRYVLDRDGSVCHRTQCALRAILLPATKWESFVNGDDGGEMEQEQINAYLFDTVLSDFDRHIKQILRQVELEIDERAKEQPHSACAMLRMRYLQLQSMVEAARKKAAPAT